MIYFSFPASEFTPGNLSSKVLSVLDELVPLTFGNENKELLSITLITKNIRAKEEGALSEIYVFFLTEDTSSTEHLEMQKVLDQSKEILCTHTQGTSNAGAVISNISII